MARSPREAIIIVLDVGKSVGETFLQNATLCAVNIIQRKILSESKDEIGLILLGSEETNNQMAEDESYQHIEIAHSLQLASWKIVSTISKYKKCTTADGDWLDALIVAADLMKSASEGKIFKEKKIVMLTNFCSDVSDDDVNFVIQGLQSEKIQVIAIGPKLYGTDSQETSASHEKKSQEQVEGEKLIARIVLEVENSLICSFEDAIPQLMYFETKRVCPTAWRAVLEIGTNIKIPVAAYKKISDPKPFRTHDIIIPEEKKMISEKLVVQMPSAQDPSNNEMQPKTENMEADEEIEDDNGKFTFVDKDTIYQIKGDDAAPVGAEDVVTGFMFGSTVVPVTNDDMETLAYSSGPKCLSVLGFTKKQNVPQHVFAGKGCLHVFPEKQEGAMKAFSALIQAMDSKNLVGIVRRVYRLNTVPVLNALIPFMTEDCQCFVLIELPYSEAVKTLIFPPLVTEKNKPSEEQLNAVDLLISNMNLMEDDEEALDPHKTLDPYLQHFHSVVAKKALSGDTFIVGSEVDEAVRLLLSPSDDLVKSAKPAFDKIKQLFELVKVTPKEGARKAAADLFKQDPDPATAAQTISKPMPDTKAITLHVGTIQPQEDFMNLLSQGVPLNEACNLLGSAIMKLAVKAFDDDDLNKPYKCLLCMRKICLEKQPSVYNNWIMKFKNDLPPEKIGFWRLIANDFAGLITTSESDQSTVSNEEAKNFLHIDDVVDDAMPTQSADEDLDDLINQM